MKIHNNGNRYLLLPKCKFQHGTAWAGVRPSFGEINFSAPSENSNKTQQISRQ